MKLTDVLTKAKAILMILRRRWKRTLAVVVIAIPVLALANFLVSDPEPEYLTDTVEKGTLTQTVEAVATVISEKDLELKFPVSGIVDDVLVSEGDTVISLQELAKLRSGSLQAAVTAAQARLTTAYAELRLLQEGTRPEDIAIAEAELRNKQSSLVLAQAKFDTSVASLQTAQSKLTVLKQEAQIALAGEVATAESTILKELTTARASLSSVEDVFEDLTLQNIIVQEQPATYFQMETLRRSSEDKVSALINNPRSVRDYNDGLSALQEARTVIADASTAVQLAFNFISGLEPQGLFSYTKKETLRTSISTEKKDVS
ncbi:MAG: hypothetical protein KC680_04335, partial [Candidatus Peregrinibacteria bacterium]|nr:hypothetical protein [Candidatus Peregrinibacteria bacterium]